MSLSFSQIKWCFIILYGKLEFDSYCTMLGVQYHVHMVQYYFYMGLRFVECGAQNNYEHAIFNKE